MDRYFVLPVSAGPAPSSIFFPSDSSFDVVFRVARGKMRASDAVTRDDFQTKRKPTRKSARTFFPMKISLQPNARDRKTKGTSAGSRKLVAFSGNPELGS